MSCLFDSLSKPTRYGSYQLRRIICSYLSKDPIMIQPDIRASQIVEWESEQDLDEYVREMKHPSTWGGCIEIAAFCNLFHCKVNVHMRGGVVEHLPMNDIRYTADVFYSGSHYTFQNSWAK